MPANNRPARAIAIAARQENRVLFLSIAIHCTLAAILVAGLAIAVL